MITPTFPIDVKIVPEMPTVDPMTVVHTAQEWFDIAWKRAQFRYKSQTRTGTCTYLATKTRPGCFLGEGMTPAQQRKYSRSGGNQPNAEALVRNGHAIVSDIASKRQAENLLQSIQSIHDCQPISDWDARLRGVANVYGLTVPGGA